MLLAAMVAKMNALLSIYSMYIVQLYFCLYFNCTSFHLLPYSAGITIKPLQPFNLYDIIKGILRNVSLKHTNSR